MPTHDPSSPSLDNRVDVWTLSIVLRTQDEHTWATAYLQGPDVEIESTGSSPAAAGDHHGASADADLAAADVLTLVSHRLAQRALRSDTAALSGRR